MTEEEYSEAQELCFVDQIVKVLRSMEFSGDEKRLQLDALVALVSLADRISDRVFGQGK